LKASETRLERFLCDLTEPMGRRERRHWAQVYVQGLLLDGERKSIEPMARHIPGADVQALRQFVGQSPWAVEEVQRRSARKVVDLLSAPDVWIIDETAFPKAGTHSVGVARQYRGTLGKVANCQVAVSLHGSSAEASCPLNWRLFLPKEWIEDQQRAAHVRVPPGTLYRSKTELALDLIDQVRSWEVPALPLVADAFYGNDFGFRRALRQRQLPYVVEAEGSTGVWTEDPSRPLPPPKKTGRPRQYPLLEALPRPKSLQTVAQELSPGAGEPGTATFAVWPDPGLGVPWPARTAAPAARRRVAAGGMAPRRARAHQVLVGAL
jgi:SRSO17 transposase